MNQGCYPHISHHSYSPCQVSTTTVTKRNSTSDEDFNHNRPSSTTISNRQNSKKPFLKKGSRRFLASSIVSPANSHISTHDREEKPKSARIRGGGLSQSKNTYRDNTMMECNINSNVKSVADSSSGYRFELSNESNSVQLHSYSHSKSSSLSNNNPYPKKPTLTPKKPVEPHPTPLSRPRTSYLPPELLISRIKGKLISTITKPNTICKQFSDGRIEVELKEQGILQQYFQDIVFTSFQSGDFKLRWGEKRIEWIQSSKCYDIDNQLFFMDDIIPTS